MEATGNALAIARILEPHVAEVLVAHAKDARAISHAKVKTKVDAKVLAELLATDLFRRVCGSVTSSRGRTVDTTTPTDSRSQRTRASRRGGQLHQRARSP